MRAMVLGWCLAALVLSCAAARAGEMLIKPEEAALPPSSGAPKVPSVTRGITRGPDLAVVSPKKPVQSPIHFQLAFEAHGGSKINLDSFKLIYLKDPLVDLTPRVRPYVTARGLEMTGAEAPPGEHILEAKISDSDGRQYSITFVLNIIN